MTDHEDSLNKYLRSAAFSKVVEQRQQTKDAMAGQAAELEQ